MTGKDLFTYAYNNQGVPYGNDLFKEIQNLTNDKLEYLANSIAPHYFNGTANDVYNIKMVALMAKVLNQGKDPMPLTAHQDYASAARVQLNTLADFQSKQQFTYENPSQPTPTAPTTKPKTSVMDAQYINAIQSFISSKESGLRPHYEFFYSNTLDNSKLSPQGFKFHIAMNTPQDFYNTMKTLVPVFNELGVRYKIAPPKQYFNNERAVQNGKAITVYPDKKFEIIFSDKAFDDKYLQKHFTKDEIKHIKNVRNQFENIKNCLFNESVDMEHTPPGDLIIGNGRLFARYGRDRQQLIHFDRMAPFQKEMVSVALLNAGLISSYQECNNLTLKQKGLLDKDGNFKISFIQDPTTKSVCVDPKFVNNSPLPNFLSQTPIIFDDICLRQLSLEDKLEQGIIDRKSFMQEMYTGVPDNKEGFPQFVFYEYGPRSAKESGPITSWVEGKKQEQILETAKSQLHRAVYGQQYGYSPDFTYDASFIEHDGKHYMVIPRDAIQVVENSLRQNPNPHIRLADFENDVLNRYAQQQQNQQLDNRNLGDER